MTPLCAVTGLQELDVSRHILHVPSYVQTSGTQLVCRSGSQCTEQAGLIPRRHWQETRLRSRYPAAHLGLHH